MEERETNNREATSRQDCDNQQILWVNGCEVTVRFSQQKNLLAQQRVIDILTESYLNCLCKT
jgi:hypothetical protein